jgi:hypothetical protein
VPNFSKRFSRCFLWVTIFFSQLNYQLQVSFYLFLKLWLQQREYANPSLTSQQAFRNKRLFFRQRLLFVLDLPIRLTPFSSTMSTFALFYKPNRRQRVVSFLLIGFLCSLSLWWFLPVQAQATNGIVQPAPGDVLSGIVIIQGTATDGSFLRYELAFLNQSSTNSDWIVFAQGDQPVINGTLAVWDTTVGRGSTRVFPDGRYQLRLRVVRQDYNYDEYFVANLTIANESGTPTPTATITTTAPLVTVTPGIQETALPQITQPAPDILPSLTPFPTPSPQATPINEPLGPGSEGDNGGQEEQRGIFEQLGGIDTGRLGEAFWQGVRWVTYAFAVLAAYLLLRGVLRRLWRLLLNRLTR